MTAQKIVDATLRYTQNIDWDAISDDELWMWFYFGCGVVAIEDDRHSDKERLAAKNLRELFLKKQK